MDLFYNTRRLNQIFLILNAVAIVLIGIVLYKEHRPEWYPYQATYIQLLQEFTEKEYKRIKEEVGKDEEFKSLQGQLTEVSNQLGRNPRYSELSRQISQLRQEVSAVQTKLAEVRLDYLHYEDQFFWARNPTKKERYRQQLVSLKPEIEKLTKELEERERRLAEAEKAFTELDKERQELLKKIGDKQFQLTVAETAFRASFREEPSIRQIHKPELNLVDRCTTCHAGYDKSARWKEFIEGKIRQARRRNASPKEIQILQALLPHPRTEKCAQCGHVQDYGVGQCRQCGSRRLAEDPPILSKHPFDQFGCTSCHGGQGVALKKEQAHARDERHWLRPMLPKDYTEAACGHCHRYEMVIPGAPRLTKGRQLFALLGCFGCHDAKGYEKAVKIGPSLTHIAAKVSDEWLFQWLKNPDQWAPHSRMPMFFLSDDEAWALVAYLKSVSKPLTLPYRYPGGNPQKGRQLVRDIGCLGCHNVPGLGGPKSRDKGSRLLGNYDFGPDLGKFGSKVSDPDWIYNWLLDPKLIDEMARMPKMRLTQQEAADITAFLLTLKEPPGVQKVAFSPRPNLSHPELINRGFRLVANYGCHGCHNIPDPEAQKLTKIGKDLSTQADLDVHLIDFGGLVLEIFDTAPTYWDRAYRWLERKLKEPRIFREGLRMPQYGLTDEEVKALVTALLSFTGRDIHKDYFRDIERDAHLAAAVIGRELVMGYNCMGCHVIEGFGGDIWPLLKDGMQPPDLKSQGFRTHHDWLFRFLKDPTLGTGRQHSIRPWLQVRMPTFGFDDETVNSIIRYFAALDNQSVFKGFRTPYRVDPHLVQKGKPLFDQLQCLACHPTGPVQPGADVAQLAPSLNLAWSRLQPEWIFQFLLNPNAFQPGTRMPTFFPIDEQTGKHQTPLPEIMGGDVEQQVRALREYVLSLGAPKTPPISNGARQAKKP
ncbi:MAG: c-type cytochrome [Armatimonadetes bacterium]|nr:c-type cytochrome [Armatimonadota bacterium]MDW8121812.1 c-type cytochrome [Armatimonadota bacterium]